MSAYRTAATVLPPPPSTRADAIDIARARRETRLAADLGSVRWELDRTIARREAALAKLARLNELVLELGHAIDDGADAERLTELYDRMREAGR